VGPRWAGCRAALPADRREYLSLLGPATKGQCAITAPYVARFSQPRPGQKVFIVTCQQKNGWKAQDYGASGIVPLKPLAGEQQRSQGTKAAGAATPETPEAQTAPTQGCSSLSRAVYKGCTPDAQGMYKGLKHVHPVSIPCTPLVHGFRVALLRLGMLGMAGAGGAER
jgi:hypothetical protein